MAGKMTDQDIANTILNDYKFMCSSLNTYITEAQNVSLRNDYISILQNSYQIQKEIFDTMNKKGWYEIKPADVSDIAKAQNQYANIQL
ncbi:MAG: spore coat protein [Candidatus Syntrophonatronum acetioxidans]|uniref:Spore coat protein n=1 Tax=Candidatus Syntrophonatronum acetioxidans TaxID=1795816 RepID=A0A424YHZ1_9FIRM|nr:MAG: spore coat protein [Candidatus Syntrophonatronum acetioxidans]